MPPDRLHRAPEKGLHFGFPYCHAGDIPDPEYGERRRRREFTPPTVKLDPHVAPLGMKFYTGQMFPRKYRNQIFIAEHGSWNRSVPIGYRITRVRLEGKRAAAYDNGSPSRKPVFTKLSNFSVNGEPSGNFHNFFINLLAIGTSAGSRS